MQVSYCRRHTAVFAAEQGVGECSRYVSWKAFLQMFCDQRRNFELISKDFSDCETSFQELLSSYMCNLQARFMQIWQTALVGTPL
jgi:hypothetical protein